MMKNATDFLRFFTYESEQASIIIYQVFVMMYYYSRDCKSSLDFSLMLIGILIRLILLFTLFQLLGNKNDFIGFHLSNNLEKMFGIVSSLYVLQFLTYFCIRNEGSCIMFQHVVIRCELVNIFFLISLDWISFRQMREVK